MTIRHVCCGYRDINGKHILCSKIEERQKYFNPTANDSHGPCDDCHKKEMSVINEWLERRETEEMNLIRRSAGQMVA